MNTAPKPKVAISSCLLGHKVSCDEGHKHFEFAARELARVSDIRPFCLAVTSSPGTPKAALRPDRHDGEIGLLESRNPGIDVTSAVERSAAQACRLFSDLSGFILKKDPPGYALKHECVCSDSVAPESDGQGIFTTGLMQAFPHLPVEEGIRLSDSALRESFIERVFVYARWQELAREGLTPSTLMRFHARHKFSLLSRDESVYRTMGPLVATVNRGNLQSVAEEYISNLMQALKRPASRKRHCNVLMHLMGYFKATLNADEKREMLEILNEYRSGLIPLVVPLSMLKRYLRRTPDPYLSQQTYLEPYRIHAG